MRWLYPISLVIALAVFPIAGSPGAETKDEPTTSEAVPTILKPQHAGEVLDGVVRFTLFEGIPNRSWEFELGPSHEAFDAPSLALVALPKKYSDKGIIVDRSNPFLVRGELAAQWKAGNYRFLVQAKSGTRLYVDDELVCEIPFMETNASGHESVPELVDSQEVGVRVLPPGHQESVSEVQLEQGDHFVRVDTVVGGKGLRAELGELCVAVSFEGEPFTILATAGDQSFTLTDADWEAFTQRSRQHVTAIEKRRRSQLSVEEAAYWDKRHEIARQEIKGRPPFVVPHAETTTAVCNAVDRFIVAKLTAADEVPAELTDDYTFLRRITLDTVGVVPTREEIKLFLADKSGQRRARVIDRLLDDPRWADHWVGYWQDVLAENPGILKPKLNNTGPFRVWIYESFLDNKPFDRFVSELVMMRGSKYGGGPAGFGMASQNDVPPAAKAHVLTKAFMGLEMKCARCHDAPYHPYQQGELFSVAAMLHREALKLPKTSSVALSPDARPPAVTVSLRPGDTIAPNWPFGRLAPNAQPDGVLRDANDPRERLAAILTSPRNDRFAQTIVNRLWHRYLGRGLVEPVDDWDDAKPSHPQLLDYLARELVANGYDLKHVARLILNSHVYQRQIVDKVDARLFAAPSRRRLTAEQIVDSLFVVSGKPFRSEALTLDPEGRRPASTFLNLGVPRRAWQFVSLSNERDRPALALPIAQSIIDTLVTFGWRDSRPQPLTERDETATALQPLILANGVMARRMAQLSDDSALTELAMVDMSLNSFVDELFLQILCRPPSAAESAWVRELLAAGYPERHVENAVARMPSYPRTSVSWSNHLSPEATQIKMEMERAALAGDPTTERLAADWRERCEDVVWALVNSPEFVFVP